MKLTVEGIKRITVGAVETDETAEGLQFWKCTKKQREAWKRLQENTGQCALATTGIMLDFHTDAKKVVFEVTGSRFEVLIDGLLTQQVNKAEEEAGKTYEICVEKEAKDRRITLIFPSHGFGVLQSVTVEDGAYVKPHEYDRKILFIGDSITQGWDSAYDCMSYAQLVSRHFNANHVINGIGGAFYHIDPFDVPDFDPDVVIVAYGTNDFLRYTSKDEYQGQVAAYLDKVKEVYGAKTVFVITPIPRFDSQVVAMGTFEECREVVRYEAGKRGLIVVDGYDVIPRMEDFYADVVHPNTLGFGVYAERLIQFMTPYL